VSAEAKAVEALIYWQDHPAQMVRDLFHVEPDAWQEKVLEEFPHHPRQAMMCCKGPGKTTVLAWLCWNFLLTRGPSTKIGAVSITATNLKDNLWAEMAKWRSASQILRDQFEWKSEHIEYKGSPELAANWFMSAKSWPQSANETQLGTALAGLWADHVMFVLDESGDIPIGVLRTAEAALGTLSVQGREAHVILAGNTTSVEGCLYYAAVKHRSQWKTYHVTADPDDPNRTPRISADFVRAEIAEHTRDNPFVKINYLGQFPDQGVNQLMSVELVEACLGRHLHMKAYDWAPRILGCDVADQGDDRTVWFPRQGYAYLPPIILRKMDSVQVAGVGMAKANHWNADSIQVDATGGYGSGPIAIMKDQGYRNVMAVQFAGESDDPRCYRKRDEIIWKLAGHVKEGASLPTQYLDMGGRLFDLGDLVAEFSTPTFGYKGDKIVIEPTALIKARLGRSPDLLMGAACTHAYPVATTRSTSEALFPFDIAISVSKSRTEYDPLTRE
jgi:hypothetical protein